MAMGERSPLALIDPAASARMAIGEALTNLASVVVEDLGRVVLSANWMAAAGRGNEDQALFDAVDGGRTGTVSCARYRDSGRQRQPVDAHAMARRTRRSLGDRAGDVDRFGICAGSGRTRGRDAAVLRIDRGATRLLLIDLGRGANRLGGSALAQTYEQLGDRCPDVRRCSATGRTFSASFRRCCVTPWSLAYHDRSDGGLIVARAGNGICGTVRTRRSNLAASAYGEARAIAARSPRNSARCCRLPKRDVRNRATRFAAVGLGDCVHDVGAPHARSVESSYAAAIVGCSTPTARLCSVVGPKRVIGCSGCATIPAARTKSSRRSRADDPGTEREAHVCAGRGHRRAVREPRRATTRSGAARTGRQQSSGDGGRIRTRRVRSV